MSVYPGWNQSDWDFLSTRNHCIDQICTCLDLTHAYIQRRYLLPYQWYLSVITKLQQLETNQKCTVDGLGCLSNSPIFVTELTSKLHDDFCSNNSTQFNVTDDLYYFYAQIPFVDTQECMLNPSTHHKSTQRPFYDCYSQAGRITLGILISLLCLIGICIMAINGLVIVVYFNTAALRRNYIYYFKLNITVADLLVGLNCLLVVYIELQVSSFEDIPVYRAGFVSLSESLKLRRNNT